MEKDLEKFLNKAKHIKLSESERGLMRGKLEEFMWKNPIKIQDKKPRQFYFAFITWRVGIAVFAFLLIAGSAGASVLSKNALPGEKLYTMKVGVNEEVKTFFAFTDEAKAKVNADIAEVRLLEVEKLAEQGKLDRQKREKLEAQFKVHADLFEEKVKKIEAKDNEKAENQNGAVDVEEQYKKKEKNKRRTEDLKNKFEERLVERERALENIRQKRNEMKQIEQEQKELTEGELKESDDAEDHNDQEEIEDEEEEDEVEPILKEVRGRMKSKRSD